MAVKYRLKVHASYNNFISEIERLEKFDFSNHKKFVANELSKSQIELLVESIFFAAFRNYEGFLREIFILYCLEKQPIRNAIVHSYLKPRNFEHSEQLIKSSMKHLDWTSPDIVIARSEVYLQNGHPIKLPYTTNRQQLYDFKKLRNHIAHNSPESEDDYKKVLKNYYNVLPLKIPTPGRFLMEASRSNAANYLLLDFFDLMKTISSDLT